MIGKILNVQRMSIHDGPGIRTTVFLKGCPLRCAWCHNPESQKADSEIAWHVSRCVLCGLCVQKCPMGALKLSEGRVIRDDSKCAHCFRCAQICPQGAWELYGYETEPETLVQELLKDKAYFDKTGGGVTFSGGEPLWQTDFVAECERLLREAGVPTAVETSCFGTKEKIESLIRHTDFFMVDLKVMDDMAHRKWIGSSVFPVLSGIELLSERNADVLIRIPVVSGCNDSIRNMELTAEFLTSRTTFRRIELLKMHKLAENKYDSLNREYPVAGIAPPSDEKIAELADALKRRGIQVLYKGETV